MWVALTAGGISQHPLAIANPHVLVDDERRYGTLRDRLHDSTVTLKVNFPGGFTESLSLVKKRAGRQATWYWRPRIKIGEAFMFSTCETPHSAVVLKEVGDFRRVSAEMRVLVVERAGVRTGSLDYASKL